MNETPPGVGSARNEQYLTATSLSARYGSTKVLDNVDLDVRQGEFVALLGPSGSGKTTLLRLLAGFLEPASGEISMNGRAITKLPPWERNIGMVFQQYALFPHRSVEKNVAFGLKVRKWERERIRDRVQECLKMVQMERFHDRLPKELSGGQQQRVALARALAISPAVLLMDEPLGSLDRSLKIDLQNQILSIHRELNTTIIYVTHDHEEAFAMADRCILLRDGNIVDSGNVNDLYRVPKSLFAARFFGAHNVLPFTNCAALSNDEAEVECLGQIVRVASDDIRHGGRGWLAVPTRGFAVNLDGNVIDVDGMVTDIRHLGDMVRLTIEVPDVGFVVGTYSGSEVVRAEKIGDNTAVSLDCNGALLIWE